jgi:hypothetical protein
MAGPRPGVSRPVRLVVVGLEVRLVVAQRRLTKLEGRIGAVGIEQPDPDRRF